MPAKKFLNETLVINKYKELFSLRKVSIYFNVSTPFISNILKTNNIIKNSSRKYQCDFNYFNKIDTDDKAYWLGYLYADASILSCKKKKELRLKIKDIEILQKFNLSLKSNYPIKHEKGTNCHFICIGSKVLVKDLINQGCMPKKSLILKFPNNLSPCLYSHFIRGYFDGDGCISFQPLKYQKCLNMIGTLDITVMIRNILLEYGVKSISLKKYKNKNVYYYLICQNFKDILKIHEYLYRNSSIFLERKRNIFNKIISYCKERHHDYFLNPNPELV